MDVSLSSAFEPVLWASIRLRFPTGCGSNCLPRLRSSSALATVTVSGHHPKGRGICGVQPQVRHYKCTKSSAKMLQFNCSPQLAGNLGAQMPRFPQLAGNSPQRAGNLPAFEWKSIRTPLEIRPAAQRNDLRSWLERFPQWAGNIVRITSLLSVVSVTL